MPISPGQNPRGVTHYQRSLHVRSKKIGPLMRT
jgi:hypothetical protein